MEVLTGLLINRVLGIGFRQGWIRGSHRVLGTGSLPEVQLSPCWAGCGCQTVTGSLEHTPIPQQLQQTKCNCLILPKLSPKIEPHCPGFWPYVHAYTNHCGQWAQTILIDQTWVTCPHIKLVHYMSLTWTVGTETEESVFSQRKLKVLLEKEKNMMLGCLKYTNMKTTITNGKN